MLKYKFQALKCFFIFLSTMIFLKPFDGSVQREREGGERDFIKKMYIAKDVYYKLYNFFFK